MVVVLIIIYKLKVQFKVVVVDLVRMVEMEPPIQMVEVEEEVDIRMEVLMS